MRKTTKGWNLLVIWEDQSNTWIPLKDLKESNPVEVAEFLIAWCIEDEPTFCWWVSYVLRKQDYIISAVKSRVRKTTHKFSFLVSARVDADHAGDTTTRRSRTGYIVYVNSAPVYWMYKKQNYVGTSSFGSEFSAMKHYCDYLWNLVTNFE